MKKKVIFCIGLSELVFHLRGYHVTSLPLPNQFLLSLEENKAPVYLICISFV